MSDILNKYELHGELCKVLIHPLRLYIMDALRRGEKSVGELLEGLNVSKANISQHLAILKSHGIISARREGQNIFYKLEQPKIIEAMDTVHQILIGILNSEKSKLDKLTETQ
jgi:ArsR family transcriptional regulator